MLFKEALKGRICRFHLVPYFNTCSLNVNFFKIWSFRTFFLIYETFCVHVLKIWRSKFPKSKSCFSKKHKKLKLYRFYDVKKTWNWILRMHFSQLPNCFNFFKFKIWNVSKVLLQNMRPCKVSERKIWLFVKFLQKFNLTLCKIFNQKSCFSKSRENAKNVVLFIE